MAIINCIRELRELYLNLEAREGDGQRYGHKNKALEDKWLKLKKTISNKCELNEGVFTLKYGTQNGFYSSEKAKMYFFHRQVTSVGTKGIYILLFLNQDKAFTIALTQGRKQIADQYGDENRAEIELVKIARKFSKKYKNELCKISNIKIKSSDDIGIKIASKEFNLDTVTEREFIDDFSIFQQVYSDIAHNEDKSKSKSITRKIRDGKFKRLLLERDDQCLITGCKISSVLEGAHIIPHADTEDDSLDNGLLLRADVHKLYDSNLLGIDGDGKLHFSSLLLNNNYISCEQIAEELITPKMKRNLNDKFKKYEENN